MFNNLKIDCNFSAAQATSIQLIKLFHAWNYVYLPAKNKLNEAKKRYDV